MEKIINDVNTLLGENKEIFKKQDQTNKLLFSIDKKLELIVGKNDSVKFKV